jgi:drug/metabolite transporter (DMT)-like permease
VKQEVKLIFLSVIAGVLAGMIIAGESMSAEHYEMVAIVFVIYILNCCAK